MKFKDKYLKQLAKEVKLPNESKPIKLRQQLTQNILCYQNNFFWCQTNIIIFFFSFLTQHKIQWQPFTSYIYIEKKKKKTIFNGVLNTILISTNSQVLFALFIHSEIIVDLSGNLSENILGSLRQCLLSSLPRYPHIHANPICNLDTL